MWAAARLLARALLQFPGPRSGGGFLMPAIRNRYAVRLWPTYADQDELASLKPSRNRAEQNPAKTQGTI